jgi:hypothetical protein
VKISEHIPHFELQNELAVLLHKFAVFEVFDTDEVPPTERRVLGGESRPSLVERVIPREVIAVDEREGVIHRAPRPFGKILGADVSTNVVLSSHNCHKPFLVSVGKIPRNNIRGEFPQDARRQLKREDICVEAVL